MSKTIYDLELHEVLIIGGGQKSDEATSVQRVPGGWIYETSGLRGNNDSVSFSVTSTFVPYSEEFKPRTGKASDSKNWSGGFR